jgi:hypothetical protein
MMAEWGCRKNVRRASIGRNSHDPPCMSIDPSRPASCMGRLSCLPFWKFPVPCIRLHKSLLSSVFSNPRVHRRHVGTKPPPRRDPRRSQRVTCPKPVRRIPLQLPPAWGLLPRIEGRCRAARRIEGREKDHFRSRPSNRPVLEAHLTLAFSPFLAATIMGITWIDGIESVEFGSGRMG